MIWNGHIDESVFALSFQENVVVFNESKDKRLHRSSVFACVYSTPNDTGVGIVSVYLLSGSTTTFLKISDETVKCEAIDQAGSLWRNRCLLIFEHKKRMKRIFIGIAIGIILGYMVNSYISNMCIDYVDIQEKCSKPEFFGYIVQALGAILTFIAVLVALFGDKIRSGLFKGRCKISLKNNGFEEKLGNTDSTTSPKAKSYDCTLNVVNIGNRELINCNLILSEILYKSDTKQKKDKIILANGHKALYWLSKDTKDVHLVIGDIREICLIRISPKSIMQTPDGKGGSPLRLNISGYSLNLEYSQKEFGK